MPKSSGWNRKTVTSLKFLTFRRDKGEIGWYDSKALVGRGKENGQKSAWDLEN